MKNVTFSIEGMHCDGCAQTICAVVSSRAGVQAVDASFDEGRARVLYDPQSIDDDTLTDAIQQLGFRVTSRTSTGSEPSTLRKS